MGNRDTATAWFKRGFKPLQSQFAQLFNWIWFKDEPIPISAIDTLNTILIGKADAATVSALLQRITPDIQTKTGTFTYAMLAGIELEKIIFKPDADITLAIGTTVGGSDLSESLTYEAGVWNKIPLYEFNNVDRTLYFTMTSVNTLFYFYRR